ncbi:MAG: TIGR00270 family protein [Nanoarchaeota archaeon]|nr:TIGR00270 family protein [Nanoarchaeota archaeon]MBU1269361.1 TIGR00270 family protein [Nanoarchaeota archaeon]MBU1596921.1 TIGR00270 family protein [Nanoarchaeota archaeon]MBU2442362.1 TIGR00270 family protein [Nanoarchaeota archaeon]
MCDMCSSPEKVYKIEIEGTLLNACEKCAEYGKIVAKIKKDEPQIIKQRESFDFVEHSRPNKKTTTIQMIVPNYSVLIKEGRERLELKQEEVAKKIAEKESIVHKLESGRMKPNVPLARKFEKFLNIKLVEEIEEESLSNIETPSTTQTGSLTIGDMIKRR